SSRTISFPGGGLNTWHLFFVDEASTIYGGTLAAIALLTVLAVAGGILTIYMLRRIIEPVIQPVIEADLRVRQLASGRSLTPSVRLSGGELSAAVDTISHKMDNLSVELENQRLRHARDV